MGGEGSGQDIRTQGTTGCPLSLHYYVKLMVPLPPKPRAEPGSQRRHPGGPQCRHAAGRARPRRRGQRPLCCSADRSTTTTTRGFLCQPTPARRHRHLPNGPPGPPRQAPPHLLAARSESGRRQARLVARPAPRLAAAGEWGTPDFTSRGPDAA